jgi:hypothetical protein
MYNRRQIAAAEADRCKYGAARCFTDAPTSALRA